MTTGADTLRGSANAAERFCLGLLLEEAGELTLAEQAYRDADSLGHGGAALNLGVLLEARGEAHAAEESYARARERGDSNAAFNLGAVLAERGDLAGARAAYELGNTDGALTWRATAEWTLTEDRGHVARVPRLRWKRRVRLGLAVAAAALAAGLVLGGLPTTARRARARPTTIVSRAHRSAPKPIAAAPPPVLGPIAREAHRGVTTAKPSKPRGAHTTGRRGPSQRTAPARTRSVRSETAAKPSSHAVSTPRSAPASRPVRPPPAPVAPTRSAPAPRPIPSEPAPTSSARSGGHPSRGGASGGGTSGGSTPSGSHTGSTPGTSTASGGGAGPSGASSGSGIVSGGG